MRTTGRINEKRAEACASARIFNLDLASVSRGGPDRPTPLT